MSQSAIDLIRAFVDRDHEGLADSKALYWIERKVELGPAEGVRIADDLRRQVIAQRQGWPSDEERASDLATHQRVSELLSRVDLRSR